MKNVWMLPVLVALALSATRPAHAEDEAQDDADTDAPACAPAEIAAARSFVPTAAQLKAYVDATEELMAAARKDAALAAALKQGRDREGCRVDETTTVLGGAGAKAMFARVPAVARIFTGRGVSAADMGRWSFVAVPMAMSADPKYGSLARQALSPPQAAFVTQQAGELQRLGRVLASMR